MVDTESIGLFIPQIDDRSEETIYQQATNVAANRSRGQLNDFSDSSPLGVLIRSQAFAGSELLWRANKIPLALVLKLLELTGVERSLGQRAAVALTFYLTAPQTVPFNVPAGFEVSDSTGAFKFTTDALLTIPAGAVSGVIDATAAETGTAYNLPAFTITQFTQPLAFLSAVANTADAQGGDVEETVEAAIERGLAALRTRNPVSESDFELEAENMMGGGSRARAIGLLDGNRRANIPGAVHIFCLAQTGEPANPALLNRVSTTLAPRIMLGTSLYVSPMELLQVSGEIVAKLEAEVDPDAVADALWANYQNFFDPAANVAGRSVLIQELRHQLRFAAGIQFIDEVQLNNGFIDIPMPNEWTLPEGFSLAMTLADVDGNLFQLVRGAGEPPEFESPD